LQVRSDSGTLAPYVPRALLARLARQPIDVLDSLSVAGQDMLRDRDEILDRLKIERLPVPVLAP
jgi:hypothetical protein